MAPVLNELKHTRSTRGAVDIVVYLTDALDTRTTTMRVAWHLRVGECGPLHCDSGCHARRSTHLRR